MPEGSRPDPPANSIRLVVGQTFGADTPVANTLWVRNGSAVTPSQGDLDGLCDYVGTIWKNRFLPQLSNALVLTNVDAWYYGAGGIALAAARSVSGTGGKAGVALPSNVALCVGWNVQQHYKGGHPRTYLAGPAADQLTGGRRFQQSYVDAVRGAANGFETDFSLVNLGGLGTLKLGVVSFVNKNAWRTPPIFRDFTANGAHVDSRVDSMRRRLGRDIPP